MAIVLGVSCFYHDAAACLLRDGVLVAAAQEERFSRVKHDARFPIHAINYCLEEAGVGEEAIDVAAYYENPALVLDRIGFEIGRADAGDAWRQFHKLAPAWGFEKLDLDGSIRRRLPGFRGDVVLARHHWSHAAAAYYPSPHERAAILTIDGVGEWASATIAHGVEGRIELLAEMRYPDSVGLLYSAATHYLGFKVNSGEYKVMGLAPYGEARFREQLLDEIVSVNEDGSVSLNPRYFDLSGLRPMATPAWAELLGVGARGPESELSTRHMDVAASIQSIAETCMLRMGRHAAALTGERALCLGGGVALNCVGNGKLLRDGVFEEIWIQPAAGDAGNALGAACIVHAERQEPAPGQRPAPAVRARVPRRAANARDGMQGALLGPAFRVEEITDFLDLYGFPYRALDEQAAVTIVLETLLDGGVVGLVQGRMEFGPRALGARSIIGDPRSPQMQRRINLKVKFRESFRPFAPVVLEDALDDWFVLDRPSPYMLLVAEVARARRRTLATEPGQSILERLQQARSEIAAVTHVDFSARVQSVGADGAPRLRALLERFAEHTGVPVLVNTSFNVRGEPIVCTPMDAYRCMMRSDIDGLLVENVWVARGEQPPWNETLDWQQQYGLD